MKRILFTAVAFIFISITYAQKFLSDEVTVSIKQDPPHWRIGIDAGFAIFTDEAQFEGIATKGFIWATDLNYFFNEKYGLGIVFDHFQDKKGESWYHLSTLYISSLYRYHFNSKNIIYTSLGLGTAIHSSKKSYDLFRELIIEKQKCVSFSVLGELCYDFLLTKSFAIGAKVSYRMGNTNNQCSHFSFTGGLRYYIK